MKTKSILFLISIVVVFYSSHLFGQNCEHEIFDLNIENVTSSYIINAQNGSYFVGLNINDNTNQVKILKLDSNLDTVWEFDLDGEEKEIVKSLVEDSNGFIYILGTSTIQSKGSIRLTKLSEDGSLIFSNTYSALDFNIPNSQTSGVSGTHIILDNNDLILIGTNSTFAFLPDGGIDEAYENLIARLDLNGTVIQAKTFRMEFNFNQFAYDQFGDQYSKKIIKVNDNYWLTGVVHQRDNFLDSPTLCFLAILDPNLNLIEYKQIGDLGRCYEFNNGVDMILHPNNFVYLLGTGEGYCFDNVGNDYLAKINMNGDVETIHLLSHTNHTSLLLLQDENLIITRASGMEKIDPDGNICWYKKFGAYTTTSRHRVVETDENDLVSVGESLEIYKIDSSGNHCTNLIRGIVYFDENQNCIKDELEIGISDVYITEDRTYPLPYNRGISTSQSGHFNKLVDTSKIDLFFKLPNDYWEFGCSIEDSLSYKFDDYQNKTDWLEIPFWTDNPCSNLRVRNFTPFNRICMEGENMLSLTNLAAFREKEINVQLTFPPEIEFISSNTNHTIDGKRVTFTINEIYYGRGTFLYFKTFIDCNSNINDISEVEVKIIPNNPCDPDDNIIIDSLSFLFGNSFDPNDITGYVDGTDDCYDENRNTNRIQYLIRYENLGNDYAYNVSIRDTLTPNFFDITSLQILNSSDDYNFEIEEDSILIFNFPDIWLGYPGLAWNVPNTGKGFIQFEIDSYIDRLPAVENKASIYFDNNEPIHTNRSVINLCTDFDQDGYDATLDCDDTNPDIYPGAEEICNGIDEDCNGLIDDGLELFTLYIDMDMDGFGDSSTSIEICESTFDGYVQNKEDCDDTNDEINPEGIEIPDNGIDEDCSGEDLVSSISYLDDHELLLYPNPTFDHLYIDSKGLDFTISLYSVSTSAILINQSKNSKIDMSDFSAGLYIVQIISISSGNSVIQYVVKN